MDFFSVFFLFDLLPWLVCIVLGFVVIEIYLEIFREKKWTLRDQFVGAYGCDCEKANEKKGELL